MLKYNQIGDKGARTIARFFKATSTLTHLNLFSNSIGTKGANAIFNEFTWNTTLKRLNLSCNKIDNDLNIGRALELNSTLKELLLKKNELKDARAIAKTLEVNTALKVLDLKYNKIEVEGGAALQGSLIINKMVTLDLMYISTSCMLISSLLLQSLRSGKRGH